jgi:hypothetical protein
VGGVWLFRTFLGGVEDGDEDGDGDEGGDGG